MTLGAFILGFCSIFTGLNFIVTIHKLRPEGMTWFKMPLFLWGIYATAIIQVLATPVLGITLLLLIAERALGVGIFDPALGGDPVLYQHFFWFYSHPAVYIMILPAMGDHDRADLGLLPQAHLRLPLHRLSSTRDRGAQLPGLGPPHVHQRPVGAGQHDLQLLTFSVAIPSAIKVFNWLATMYKGSISLDTPMLYALSFLFLFAIGGLTGLFLGALATDVHLHDTYFVVAHFHYVMFGGTVIAFLGGLHYWWPKMFGRMYSETLGPHRRAADLRRLQRHLLHPVRDGQPGHAAALLQLPRRSSSPTTRSRPIGSYLLGLGFVVVAVYLVHSLFRGDAAPANPWGGATLEWQSPRRRRTTTSPRRWSPATPTTSSRCAYDPETGGYVRKRPGLGAGSPGRGPDDGRADAARATATTRTSPTTSTPRRSSSSRRELGMWLFLATEILLFGGLFCAYAVYRANHPEIFIYAHQFLDKTLGGINTVVLICSSSPWPGRCARPSSSRPAAQAAARADPALRLRLPRRQVRRVLAQVEAGLLWARSYAPQVHHGEGDHGAAPESVQMAAPAGGASAAGAGAAAAQPAPATAATPEHSNIAPAATGPAGLAVEAAGGGDEIVAEPKNAQTFFWIYFLMTGLHGIHVLGGIGAMFWLLFCARRGDFGDRPLHPGRHGRALLAPGRPDLDLPVPAALPDPLGARDE